jgi:hypothetical protein
MKRYYYKIEIIEAQGTQCFYVDAESKADADELINAGYGEFDGQEIEIQCTGDPLLTGVGEVDE